MNFGAQSKCPKCDKNVYFNEKVHVMGAHWHRDCFRCANCSKPLELGKQAERDSSPYCQPCYRRLFGPKGYGNAECFPETGINKDGSLTDFRINKSSTDQSRSNDSKSNSRAADEPGHEANAQNENCSTEETENCEEMKNCSAGDRAEIKSYSSKSSPRKRNGAVRSGFSFGVGNSCAKCDKNVGFAERTPALGKLYHNDCFACDHCNRKLTVTSFTASNSTPYCQTCFKKSFATAGPQHQ